MHDMLVRLYDLPNLKDALRRSSAQGVTIRRALVPEKDVVIGWVGDAFASSRAEVEAAFSRLPVSIFIAVRGSEMLGFACYDATARNFFGPEAVVEQARGRGIGRALLLSALHAQHEQGYAYAIIGGVGPAEFYARAVGAIAIPGSTPGIYAGMLRRGQSDE